MGKIYSLGVGVNCDDTAMGRAILRADRLVRAAFARLGRTAAGSPERPMRDKMYKYAVRRAQAVRLLSARREELKAAGSHPIYPRAS